MDKHDITPSLRPEAGRTASELEKANVKHVERSAPGFSALEDEALMSGESQERVSYLSRHMDGKWTDPTAYLVCRLPLICRRRLWLLLWIRHWCDFCFSGFHQGRFRAYTVQRRKGVDIECYFYRCFDRVSRAIIVSDKSR